jgi:SAM-dependent methyltransferase
LAIAEQPSPWVERYAYLVAPSSRVLDLACGSGRHARFFTARGCQIDAVDRNAALAADFADEAAIRFLAADVESGPWPYPDGVFDAVVVTNYLHRPLLPRIAAALAPGGALLYETFAQGNECYGRPSNPDFLLRAGELLIAFGAGLHVLAYEDGVVQRGRAMRVQRLCALRCASAEHHRLQLPGAG